MTAESKPDESVLVQLTQMAGDIKLILFQNTNITSRVDSHELRLSELTTLTQRLDLDADARDRTAVALALALKEAKETAEAAGRAELTKSETRWSPIMKMSAVVTVIVGAVAIYYRATGHA